MLRRSSDDFGVLRVIRLEMRSLLARIKLKSVEQLLALIG